MTVLDRIIALLMPIQDPARLKRWRSAAPRILFRSEIALYDKARWRLLLEDDKAAALAYRSAMQGTPAAQTAWARMLLTGSGVGRDADLAFKWLSAAAKQAHPEALNMLGRCHEHGWGTKPDPATAYSLYERAASMGDVWAKFNMADQLLNGRGVDRDQAAAFELYKDAARLGHVKALNMVGLLHEDGMLPSADRNQATAFFRLGAKKGDCWAQFNLARHLTKDGQIEEALRWLEQALDTGFPAFWETMAQALSAQPDTRLRDFAQRAAHKANDETTGTP